jgi:hypothetical protein
VTFLLPRQKPPEDSPRRTSFADWVVGFEGAVAGVVEDADIGEEDGRKTERGLEGDGSRRQCKPSCGSRGGNRKVTCVFFALRRSVCFLDLWALRRRYRVPSFTRWLGTEVDKGFPDRSAGLACLAYQFPFMSGAYVREHIIEKRAIAWQ